MTKTMEKSGTLDNQDFCSVRDCIYDTCGIYFKLEKKYLIEKDIISRMSALSLNNVDEYIYYIKYHPKKDEELKVLYDFITINETSFFRNLPQINALENEILPIVINGQKDKPKKSIRIWSAACSSGEEPYTLSIVVNRVLKSSIHEWSIDILATDISSSVLNKAKDGIYNDYTLRNTEDSVKEKCFEKIKDNSYRIKEEYRKNIDFSQLNLNDDKKLSRLLCFDIIFCRNVLIYFDIKSKKRVINKLYELLKPGGHLFLGHSESLHGLSSAFKLILFKGALAYKKES